MARRSADQYLFALRVAGLALIYLTFMLIPAAIAIAPILYVIYYPPR